MCFGMGGGGSSETPVEPQTAAAIESQAAYRKSQVNNKKAYSGFKTDVVGSLIANENSKNGGSVSSAALKKLMGA